MRLHLVRHAAPVVREDTPSAQWHLSPQGRAAAEALANDECWAAVTRIYSSPEPKAIATAQRICAANGLPLSIEPALHEVERPWSEGDYRAEGESFLRGEDRAGWEPRLQATQRMTEAVERYLAAHGGADLGIVSHGLALSLYLQELLGVDGEAIAELWRGIGFPDHAVVDPSGRKLERPFGGNAS